MGAAKFGIIAVIAVMIVLVLGIVSGFILHGTNGLGAKVVLYYADTITTMNMSLYSLILVVILL